MLNHLERAVPRMAPPATVPTSDPMVTISISVDAFAAAEATLLTLRLAGTARTYLVTLPHSVID
jgi:hypothetical protein